MCLSSRSVVRRRREPRTQSLKVVVQRTLVELPESLLRKCSVEGKRGWKRAREVAKESKQKEEEIEEDESQLVTCQSCAITVHKSQSLPTVRTVVDLVSSPLLSAGCYGVPTDQPLPDESWLCRRCEQNATNAVSTLFSPSLSYTPPPVTAAPPAEVLSVCAAWWGTQANLHGQVGTLGVCSEHPRSAAPGCRQEGARAHHVHSARSKEAGQLLN